MKPKLKPWTFWLLASAGTVHANEPLSESFLLYLAETVIIDGELTDPMSMENARLPDITTKQEAGAGNALGASHVLEDENPDLSQGGGK